MCGIAGFFSLETERVKKAVPDLKRCLDKMYHRGPDQSGVYEAKNGLLGHRRLSIIDLENGKQPMRSFDNRYVITYNGEIYNYQSLAVHLREKGYTFYENSDTEVLLKSFVHWGIDCLRYLEGMFAFAIYDQLESILYLARDPLGIKPLYYQDSGTFFAFASEIPALQEFTGKNMPHLETISHYLSTVKLQLGRQTLWKEAKSVLPGEYLLLNLNQKQLTRNIYWEIPKIPSSEKKRTSLDDNVICSRKMIRESVRSQLVSDVSVGGFLSGGLDSSIITQEVSSAGYYPFQTYSIGYSEEGYNEWKYAKDVADSFQFNCQEIEIRSDLYWNDWLFLIKQKGLPLSTPNEVCIYQICRFINRSNQVILSGEGADELFGGYSVAQFGAYDFEKSSKKVSFDQKNDDPLEKSLVRLYGRSYFLSRLDHFLLLNQWFSGQKKQAILKPEIWAEWGNDRSILEYYGKHFKETKYCSVFDAHLQLHAKVNLESLLSRIDTASMASSIEVRVPFATAKIAEFLFSVPDQQKMNWVNSKAEKIGKNCNSLEADEKNLFETKRLLRYAYKRSLPQNTITRKKMSFPSPIISILKNIPKNEWDSLLNDSPLLKKIFRIKHLSMYRQCEISNETAQEIWPIINLAIWDRECCQI